jgi:hypothetical protein
VTAVAPPDVQAVLDLARGDIGSQPLTRIFHTKVRF